MLTVAEVAARKGVSRQTVLRAIRSGRLRAERAGRAYVVTPDALDDWQPAPADPGRSTMPARSTGAEEARLGAGQLRAVIDSLADAFFVFDPAGRLLHANAAARELAGGCIVGRHMDDCLQGVEIRQPDGRPLSLAEAGPASALRGGAFRDRVVIWRRPGQPERVLSLSDGTVRDSQGRVLFGISIARDVTERRQHHRDREAVAALARALVEDVSLDGVIQRILEQVGLALGAPAVTVMLATPKGDALELAGTQLPPAVAKAIRRVPMSEPSVCTHVYRTGQLQTVEDVSQDSHAGALVAKMGSAEGVRSLVVVPLRDRRGTLGLLMAAFPEPRQFTTRELKLAAAMADISAAAIQNARLYAAALERERRRELVGEVLAAITATIDVEQVPRQLVDVLLRAFAADRAWLMYPCDLSAETIGVPYEATVPAYPGMQALDRPLPTTSVDYLLNLALSQDGAVTVDLSDPSLPEAFRRLHLPQHVQSILAVRFRPRNDRPWLLGLHQCSYRRTWTAEERSMLSEIAGYAAVAIEHAQLHEQVKQALRIREEFVSSAAHELKTPATALKGYAQLLLRSAGPAFSDELARRALQAIDHSVNRIARLAHDLLEVSSLEIEGVGLRRSAFDLGELASAVVADARLAAGAHSLSCYAPSPVLVLADRDRIADVLFCLVDNAVRYSPADAAVEVAVAARHGEAVASVRDYGHGIPRERWPHLFEPLYEPHPAGGVGYVGTVSLGLYLARRIVEQHGGRVWFESKEGKGSTFFVALPLAGK